MGLFKFKSRKDGTNADVVQNRAPKKESKEISGGKRKNRIDGNAKEKKRCKKTNEGGAF